MNGARPVYCFGPFRVDVQERRCTRNGEPVSLTPKAFDMLVYMLSRTGHLLEKDTLLEELWADVMVGENCLSQNVRALRKALADEAGQCSYIETVPRRGFRFVAQVYIEFGEDEQPSPPPVPPSEPALVLQEVQRPQLERWPVRRMLFWSGATVLLGVSLFVTLLALGPHSSPPKPDTPLKSLVILPFRPLGKDRQHPHLGLGIADAVIGRLTNLGKIRVCSTGTIFHFAETPVDSVTVGRQLEVDGVLEGTFQREGERVRMTVQLIEVRSGKPIWAEQFDERFTDVFALQDILATDVSQALNLKLTLDDQKHLKRHTTENLAAYEAYSRGLFFWNKRLEPDLRHSISCFEEAIAKDPAYALAFAGMADAYGLLGYYGVSAPSPAACFEQARSAALQALALDKSLAEAHIALALVKFHADGDLNAARVELRRALLLNPNSATAHLRIHAVLERQGELVQALQHIREAHRLDPISPTINRVLAETLYRQGQNTEAEDLCRKGIEINPQVYFSYEQLGKVLVAQGEYGQALAAFQKAQELNPRLDLREDLGHLYALTGQQREVQKLLREFQQELPRRPDASINLAMIYVGLGNQAAAFKSLEESQAPKHLIGYVLRTDPRLRGLQADARSAQFSASGSGFH
ncbi:MAG: tetratricopeptide repeat protein [Blastocatellia bacterium]|nr:tetratricopeptide repeat protein [Blastocatellia bacterium]